MKEENKCIEHCDDNLLQSRKCILNYNETTFIKEPTNTKKITEDTPGDRTEVKRFP